MRWALETLKVESGIKAPILNLAYWPEHGSDEFILCLTYLGKWIEFFVYMSKYIFAYLFNWKNINYLYRGRWERQMASVLVV